MQELGGFHCRPADLPVFYFKDALYQAELQTRRGYILRLTLRQGLTNGATAAKCRQDPPTGSTGRLYVLVLENTNRLTYIGICTLEGRQRR